MVVHFSVFISLKQAAHSNKSSLTSRGSDSNKEKSLFSTLFWGILSYLSTALLSFKDVTPPTLTDLVEDTYAQGAGSQ